MRKLMLILFVLVFMSLATAENATNQTIIQVRNNQTITLNSSAPHFNDCPVKISPPFDYSIPGSFGWKGIASESLTCDFANSSKWLLSFSESEGNYSWTGIRIYIVLLAGLLVLAIAKISSIINFWKKLRRRFS